MAMTSDITRLNACRERVSHTLGDSMQLYLKLMGSWFRGKLSKDEFDEKARSMFSHNDVSAHNEFLLAMLQRCTAVMTSATKRVMSSPVASTPTIQRQKSSKKKVHTKASFSHRFQPANQLRQVPSTNLPTPDTRLLFASRDGGLLPDVAMVQGRMYVAAWEAGLSNVQTDIYDIICLATEILLKDIVSHVISRKKDLYRKKPNALGIDLPKCYLPRTEPEETEADRMRRLGRLGLNAPSNEPITAMDTFTALQNGAKCIASHTVHTLALERLSVRLSHDSIEETVAAHAVKENEAQKRRLRELANGSVSRRRLTAA